MAPHNNPIKLSVRPVTHLADASCAPARPAAYRVRWAARMNAQKAAGLLAIAFLLTGCTERIARLHSAASLAENGGSVTISDGSSAVLEYTKTSGVPIPDAFSGIGLFIELEPTRLVQNAVLAVPADVVRCIAWRLNAPWRRSAQDCSGSLMIRSVSSEAVLATLDVRSETLDLMIHNRLKYSKASQPRAASAGRRPNNAVNATVLASRRLRGKRRAARPARYRARYANSAASIRRW